VEIEDMARDFPHAQKQNPYNSSQFLSLAAKSLLLKSNK